MQYGDLSFVNEPISYFESPNPVANNSTEPFVQPLEHHHARDAKIHYLYDRYVHEKDLSKKMAKSAEL